MDYCDANGCNNEVVKEGSNLVVVAPHIIIINILLIIKIFCDLESCSTTIFLNKITKVWRLFKNQHKICIDSIYKKYIRVMDPKVPEP